LQGLRDEFAAFVHRQGQGLEHEVVPVAIDDNAGQTVAFAPDQPSQPFVHSIAAAVVERDGDSTLKEIEIKLLTLPTEAAGNDIGLRIVDGAAQKLVALDLSVTTSPSFGWPNDLRISLEYTQSCPWNIRERGLTMRPGMTDEALRL
jgi:hypothetical protein